MKRLPALGAALLVLAIAAPAADAVTPEPAVHAAKKKKRKPRPKYFFVSQQTITSVTTTDCVSITNKEHRTKETTTVVHFTEFRGYLGGSLSERGYRQTTLERTGNDPYLPPYRNETPKNEFDFPDQSADRFWKKGSEYATFSYGIIGNEYRQKLRLPRVNKEVTKEFDKTYRDEKTSDQRCNNTDKVTIKGAVTLQRIQ